MWYRRDTLVITHTHTPTFEHHWNGHSFPLKFGRLKSGAKIHTPSQMIRMAGSRMLCMYNVCLWWALTVSHIHHQPKCVYLCVRFCAAANSYVRLLCACVYVALLWPSDIPCIIDSARLNMSYEGYTMKAYAKNRRTTIARGDLRHPQRVFVYALEWRVYKIKTM